MHRLSTLVTLRSLARFEHSLKPLLDSGALDIAVSLLQEHDTQLGNQSLGLLPVSWRMCWETRLIADKLRGN
jgi:hypothetical protein